MPTMISDVHYLPADDHLPEYERTVLVVAQRRILRILYSSRTSLSISELLSGTNISLNSLVAIFVKLQKNGFVERDANGIFLTGPGRRWSLKNRKEIFMHKERVVYNSPLELDCRDLELDSSSTLPKKYLFKWVDMRQFEK